MEQQDCGRIFGPRLSVKDVVVVYFGISMMDHEELLFCGDTCYIESHTLDQID